VERPVRFRHYSENDLDQVMELCAHERWPSYADDPVRVHSVFTAPGVVSVVAESDRVVVAFAYCQSDGAIQAHLSLIVVRPSHRRQGVARGLLTFAFDYLGASRIDLITETAEDFYRSLPHKEHFGFRIYPLSE